MKQNSTSSIQKHRFLGNYTVLMRNDQLFF